MLPGPGTKAFPSSKTGQGKAASASSKIPALVPPTTKSAGQISVLPPPPLGVKGSSGTVRAFGSQEQLKTGDDDFSDFGEFRAAGSRSKASEKKSDDWGAFTGPQFKHSASEPNIQGMKTNDADDRYAALRDVGGSLFDPAPLAFDKPAVEPVDDDFADFQQAGPVPSITPLAPAVDKKSIPAPANQGSLFDSVSSGLQLKQPEPAFAAFSPPKESSDWAQAAKQDKDPKVQNPPEEEFEGFFSSRTSDTSSISSKKEIIDPDPYDQYASLAGLHSFVRDDPEEADDSFGDFQVGDTKPQTQSITVPAAKPVIKPAKASTNTGVNLFRMTPPPMSSSPPSSEESPEDDRFQVLRDLSTVDPFEDIHHDPDVDGTGADFYETQFEPIDDVTKVPSKPALDLDDTSQGTPQTLELNLDTPSTTNKPFSIGSINQLDLKNYDLNLSVDSSISKGGTSDSRDRKDSFGDFTSAKNSEPAPPPTGKEIELIKM